LDRIMFGGSMSRRPAALLLIALAAAPAVGAGQGGRHLPSLLQPLDGAVVGRQVTVRIGFADHGPQGLAEGTGIGGEGAAKDRAGSRDDETEPMAVIQRGPADGTGLIAGPDRRGPHFAVLIDQPAPAPGSAFQPDGQHVPFPIGNPQMTLMLAPGLHQLTLVPLDGEGAVARRYRETPPTTVTVRN
jgi:hypothetical protein